MAPKPGFYAVATGRQPGVYKTWSAAEEQVKGFPSFYSAKYKKFATEQEAKDFVTASRDALSSQPPPLGKRKRAELEDSKGTPIDTHFRATSPATMALPASLPSKLQKIAQQGFSFTESAPHYLVVYTDGSARGNGQVGSRAGAGVWWGSQGEASKQNWAERVPGEPQTNNRGELLAVIRAIERCPFPDIPLEVRCDSQYTISCMTIWLPKWMNNNFRNSNRQEVVNIDLIKHLLVLLRRRGPAGRVKFKYVPAHSGVEGNEAADRLARTGGALPPVSDESNWLDPEDKVVPCGPETNPTEVELEIDEDWLMTVEELAALEQQFV
ncbi:ribonuclease HI [Cryptococcus gattii E566]|uniref:Ribonuclease H n=2 Tax=Cryptococcus gattii TaxID=37769 RepID=E6R0N5_CRYGW|nr:Ribonuclease H, putative [Cryptococcus gattii WM276]ADV20448.1 Ribonuclease H, putative [Cryptococcus gattii WM276]KIR77090.1 ribonuclease HI [Cryptococcus gattii EJB2]KIY36127.1 ribonuclease HI [Cryptococcus gattii E566]